MEWEMVSRRQHLELRERKGVILPHEANELAKERTKEVRVQDILPDAHHLPVCNFCGAAVVKANHRVGALLTPVWHCTNCMRYSNIPGDITAAR